MSQILDSIRAEYQRYQVLAERALDQVPDALLHAPGLGGGNSLTVIAWHLAGNLRSRFTAFLTEDGEKPWRNREDEFAERVVSREELRAHWNAGWAALYEALGALTDAELHQTVTIRAQPLRVHDALHRSLAHVSYHVGQLVYLSHAHLGAAWEYLSIPPGGSAAYNAAPTHETPAAHVAKLSTRESAVRLFPLPVGLPQHPEVDRWFASHPPALATIARRWFNEMRSAGPDVTELLHDGHPTACVADLAFGYVNVYAHHVNVGFFLGASLDDPGHLLRGTGRFMRHVRLTPSSTVDDVLLCDLIRRAYTGMRAR